LTACANRDIKAQEILYKRFHGYAMSIAMRYAHSEEEALEILNDSFLKIFRNIQKLDNHQSFTAWMKRIVINTAIDSCRKSKKFQKHESLENISESSVEITVLESMSAEDIMKIVQSLPGVLRIVFNLFVVEGYSHKEIAEKLEIAEGTSRAHLSIANRKLRQQLKILTEYSNE
jgi:RNA polymerase sigma-70 factor (ECF subfamily)